MQLTSFRVFNFRSIQDSGDIKLARITSILGRNESGKSNLLLALRSLNPVEGFTALNPIKDFPRHRRLEECTDHTIVVSTKWKLTTDEKSELLAILPRAKDIAEIEIGRRYSKQRFVSFPGLPAIPFDEADIKSKIKKITAAAKAAAEELCEPKKGELSKAADNFETGCASIADKEKWAVAAIGSLKTLRTELAKADVELTDKQEQLLVELEDTTSLLAGDKEAQQKARDWALRQLPHFIYLDEYPDLNGHQDIAAYLQRKANNQATDADGYFEKMCKVAGLDPTKLQELLQKNEHETRNQLTNRASAVVTGEIRRLWKDRPLKVRFNVDAQHLDTFISDPNATFDVEVNLDERSRGFKWFFSFYITFSADTDGGKAEDAVLLLDEPGLYLHAKSQSDLLNHFEKDFSNQILYTTHSPFMVPTHQVDSIRTASISEQKGTTVTNDPSGDARTLFPLQAALGYDLAQSLFVGPNNLVVEGVTDFWLLSTISAYLADAGKKALRSDLAITPAGGAQKISYMVALLTSEQLNVLALLDDEKAARTTKDDLVRARLIKEQNVVFVSESIGAGAATDCDIEDLLDPAMYEALVRESYAKELKGKILILNPKIPRVAKRLESALADLGIEFHKTRPTRLFLTKMAADPKTVMTPNSVGQFEKLFELVNERLQTHLDRQGKSFQ
ncbi:AAA family ATPase [Bradyrhizobium sp. CB82]|uniref:AAA family ATPase n=1 Tax=Bradyrhizobium sp. CB82 TaxID=3039159 RepID=UPI0024B18CA8|nr:AAA family ATPase [Bradyrhizobium sp. CB82]WFU40131.1 AAA family ATPase [Bradyrhizobium sp. CB82]